MLPYNNKLKDFSRGLRGKMTDAETFLWSRLRRKQLKGHQFYRQKIIGDFIADFYCPKAKIVIEVDGGQHYSKSGQMKDKVRDEYMMHLGLTVLRFSDRDVFENIDGVIETICGYL
jgi:very-short-patch-repair endonuclease